MAIIAPSILASDWGRISEEVKNVTAAGADWLHLDVMDGNFVPPISFGPDLVAAVKAATHLPLDVHLMVEHPETHLEAFAAAGASLITVHFEACPHLHRVVQKIHELGCKAGVALNPATPVSSLESILSDVDLVLLMTVNPGWGGQRFIPKSEQRIREAAQLIKQELESSGSKRSGETVHLEVDGGIIPETAAIARKAGANVFVAGTSVFKQQDYSKAISALR